jgi:hypothetical protein
LFDDVVDQLIEFQIGPYFPVLLAIPKHRP